MRKPSVYLAGPITGLSYEDSIEWREKAIEALAPDIDAFSPLRAKTYLRGTMQIGMSYENFPLSSQRGIMCRDFFDCTQRDLLLVNFKGAKAVSIGTVMEVAWAYGARKPIVAVMEPTIDSPNIFERGNPHNHSMVMEAIPFVVPTMEEALFIVRAMLLPDRH
jgi:nucleoside 2-deoxyribosyltransferase